MDGAHGAPALPDDGEPTPGWAAEVLGISLEDADWLLVLHRFAQPDPAVGDDPWAGPRHRYYCEPLQPASIGDPMTIRLARRLRGMDAAAAAAFWIVRAESRGLDPGEVALRDAWLAEPANLAAYRQSVRILALLDAAARTKTVRVRFDTKAPRAPGLGDLS